MRGDGCQRTLLRICVARERAVFVLVVVRGQDGRRDAPSGPPPSEATPEIRRSGRSDSRLASAGLGTEFAIKRTTNRGTAHGRGGS